MPKPEALGTTEAPTGGGSPGRLRKRSDFLKAYAKGRKRVGHLLVVFRRENALGEDRLGLTVPKRVGSAVMRNLLRRRLREVFRCLPSTGAAEAQRPACDIVVNVRESAPEASFQALKAEFEALLGRGPRVAGS